MSRRTKRQRILPPYLKWRDGRPRWEPGPRLRPHFKARDLKGDGGAWLGLERAIAEARRLNDEVAAWRVGGQAPRRKPVNRHASRTCEHLWQIYASPGDEASASPRWQRLAAVTRRDYRSKIGIFLAEFGDTPVAALEPSDIYGWWEDLFRDRGHTMANSTVSAVRAMLSYAVMRGWIKINPARGLQMTDVPPRVVTWSPDEVAAAIAAGDALRQAGTIGDVDLAIIIALHTGQRQGDVRLLELPATANGRVIFRQGKTGARVSVPSTDQLQGAIDDALARRRASQVVTIQHVGPLLADRNGRPYTRESFGKEWRALRAAAATDMPSIASKLFLDLRDTAITRLALAGCTVAEIRAITGHSMDTITQVLRHYLALDDRMADNAIARLRNWMQAEGIAV